MTKPFNPGWKMSSDEWKAWAGFLFGRGLNSDHSEYIFTPTHPDPKYRSKIIYFCSRCGKEFESVCTPTACPLCKLPPIDSDAVELTHKSYIGKTFPFSDSGIFS